MDAELAFLESCRVFQHPQYLYTCYLGEKSPKTLIWWAGIITSETKLRGFEYSTHSISYLTCLIFKITTVKVLVWGLKLEFGGAAEVWGP